MDQEAVIADIEKKAWEVGVSIRRVCALASVHPTTFSRWKKSERNSEPIGANLKTIQQLYAALDTLHAEAPRRRARKEVA